MEGRVGISSVSDTTAAKVISVGECRTIWIRFAHVGRYRGTHHINLRAYDNVYKLRSRLSASAPGRVFRSR